MATADPASAEVILRLRERSPLPALFPPLPWKPWDGDIHRRLTVGDLATEAAPLRAGLLLWNDALAESHAISQGLPDADGAYWHGIMHRREGDLENAAYWFRRVGPHPVFSAVQAVAIQIAHAAGSAGNAWAQGVARDLEAAGHWSPFRFIDLCGEVRDTPGQHPVLERIQVAEFEFLLRHCAGERVG